MRSLLEFNVSLVPQWQDNRAVTISLLMGILEIPTSWGFVRNNKIQQAQNTQMTIHCPQHKLDLLHIGVTQYYILLNRSYIKRSKKCNHYSSGVNQEALNILDRNFEQLVTGRTHQQISYLLGKQIFPDSQDRQG